MLEQEGFEGDVYISPPPGYGDDAKICLSPLRTVHQQSGIAQNHVSFYGAARLQNSRLRQIYVVPPRCKRKDHGGQSHRQFVHMRHKPRLPQRIQIRAARPAKGGFEGTCGGPLHLYLGCAITRDLNTGTTFLLQAPI